MTTSSMKCPLIALVGLFVLYSHAFAGDGDPFSLGAGANWLTDSNIYRSDSASGSVQSDRASSLFALVQAETRISRQRIYAKLNAGQVRFSKLDYLDYDTQDFSGGWDGEFPRQIKAGLDWGRTQSLASFADINVPRRNVIRRDSLNAHADLPLVRNWHLVAAGGNNRTHNSNALDAAGDVDSSSVEGGLRYQTPYGNQIDAILRATDARYPNQSLSALVDTGYREQLADLRDRKSVV